MMRYHDTARITQPQGAYRPVLSLQSRRDGRRSLDHAAHAQERLLETQAQRHAFFHQVGKGLGVRFRLKDMPCGGEAALEFQVILHDAVMHQRHPAAAIGMGMGVVVGGSAVGGPAGMPQSQRTPGRSAVDRRRQPADLAHGLAQVECARVVNHGDTGAVVTAVLQPFQALVDNGPGLILANVSNNAAHGDPRFVYGLGMCSITAEGAPKPLWMQSLRVCSRPCLSGS